MNKYIFLSLVFSGSLVFAKDPLCTIKPFEFQTFELKFSPDGKVYSVEKGEKKLLLPTAKDRGMNIYNKQPGGQYEVIANSEDQTATIRMSGMSNALFDGATWDYTYKVSKDADGGCTIENISDQSKKEILYDGSLCGHLGKGFSEIASAGEMNKCSQIMKKMSDAVKEYQSKMTLGWRLKHHSLNAQNPFEKTLLFAADCRKMADLTGAKDSLAVPPAARPKSKSEVK